jgi:phage/plasmid-like protein (TIGR03299 family)
MSQLDRTEEFTDKVFTRDRRAWWSGMDVPGVNVCTDRRMNVHEAFRLYLPWEVRKVNLYDPEDFAPTDYHGLKRSDTGRILGVGSDQFTVVQNSDVEALLGEALDGAGYAVASIGALAHGKTTFVSVDFDDAPTANAGGQEVFPYLAVVNGNDGSGALRVYATGIRPECYNTIDMGWLAGVQFARLRHTTNIMSRIPEVQADVRKFLDLPAKASRVIGTLIDTRVDATAYRRALEFATPIPEPKVKDGKTVNQQAITIAEKQRDKVLDLAYNDERVGFQNTAWGLFQTFSTFDQWERRFRRTESSGVTTHQQATLTRLFSGEQASRDANRLAVALRGADITSVKVDGKGTLVLAR